MLLTIKFGGTSVGNAERIRSVAALIKRTREQGHRVVVITSAMAGVTNQFVAQLQQPLGDGESQVEVHLRFTKKLEQEHLETARRAIRERRLVDEVARALYAERHALDRVLLGSHLLGELTPLGRDFVVSGGERLCVPVLANCLRDLGVDAVGLGGDEAGIVTDNNYGNALPLEGPTRPAVRQALLPLLEAGKVPVVAGFYGRSLQGRITVLGRGGSDYSATTIGAALDADEIWIMKDVAGIQTADPRLVEESYTIPELSYRLAAEMALLGAKVLHPKSVQPAARQRIPVRIASSFNPEVPGSRLVALEPAREPRVAALTVVRRGGLVRAAAAEVGDESEVPASFASALRRANVDVLASAAGFNGGSTLWLLGPQELDRFLEVLNREQLPFQTEVQRGVAVVGIVGERVATAAGILARVARCLEKAGREPLAILQGASPHSVVIALPDDEQLPAALRLLHTELGLDRSRRTPLNGALSANGLAHPGDRREPSCSI
jgi:aspartate kinase